MRRLTILLLFMGICVFTVAGSPVDEGHSCSSFMLKKGPVLLFGHNLDSGKEVPGMVFINKRGILKTGCTLKQLTSPDQSDPSNLTWISKYGSITLGSLGANFPDGGMNETGMFVWEMSLMNTTFIQDKTLPRLFMMQWMQYVLDTCSTVEQALQCATSIAMDGWNWHFFVGDRSGKTAAIEFILGRPVIHANDNMPIPMLGNTPYADEMERLRFYRGFGGSYPAPLQDLTVDRFVHAAIMLREYQVSQPPVDYAFDILKKMWGDEPSKWSAVCDPLNMIIYFRSNQRPEIKHFSMDKIDWSNRSPVRSLDIHTSETGDVFRFFKNLKPETNRKQIEKRLTGWWKPDNMPKGWVSMNTLIDRFASYYGAPVMDGPWEFSGTWTGEAIISSGEPLPDTNTWTITICCDDGRISGEISDSSGKLKKEALEHFSLAGRKLSFTFRIPYIYDKKSYYRICRVESYLEQNRLKGSFFLYRSRYGEPGHISLQQQK